MIYRKTRLLKTNYIFLVCETITCHHNNLKNKKYELKLVVKLISEL